MAVIAGLLFAIAGLLWTLAGNTPIGMMYVSVAMLCVAMAASNSRRQ